MRLRPRVTAVLGLALVLLLGACGIAPRKELNTDFAERNWGIRRSNIAAVQSFVLKGRVAESGIAGLQGFEASSWFGLLAPAGLPRAIATRLTTELSAVLNDPEADIDFALEATRKAFEALAAR